LADTTKENRSIIRNKKVYPKGVLRLGSYSRIDFIVDNDYNIFCLEANTLPGMTPASLLPQEAKANGITYTDLCDRIVKMALCDK